MFCFVSVGPEGPEQAQMFDQKHLGKLQEAEHGGYGSSAALVEKVMEKEQALETESAVRYRLRQDQ